MQRYLIPEFQNERIKKHKVSRPQWGEELNKLWKYSRDKECKFLKYKEENRVKKAERLDYVDAGNVFDKAVRRTERTYQKSKAMEFKDMATENANEFWRRVETLGPRKERSSPGEVMGENVTSLREEHVELEKWKTDLENLFNKRQEESFDEEHYNRCKTHKYFLEMEMNDPLYIRKIQNSIMKILHQRRLFAYDMVEEINSLSAGVQINDISISLRMYADDIVLIADSEVKLQSMLDKLQEW